ncbi:hypothetical protein LTS17_007851 [Exophiala oligosperma]
MEGEKTVELEDVIGDHPHILPTIEEATGALMFLKVEMHTIFVVSAEVRARRHTGVDAARAAVQVPVQEDIPSGEARYVGMSLQLEDDGIHPPVAHHPNKSDASAMSRKG